MINNYRAIARPNLRSSRDRYYQPDYSLRYGDINIYKRKVWQAHQKLKSINGLCACCMINQATEMHHTEYGGEEVLGINWFGVCLECHSNQCHHPNNWIKHLKCPELLNHNTWEFTRELQSNYKKLGGK